MMIRKHWYFENYSLKRTLTENKCYNFKKRLFSFIYLKATLKLLWKSTYVFVFIQKQYAENTAFLIRRILECFTGEVCIFIKVSSLLFNIFERFLYRFTCMFFVCLCLYQEHKCICLLYVYASIKNISILLYETLGIFFIWRRIYWWILRFVFVYF